LGGESDEIGDLFAFKVDDAKRLASAQFEGGAGLGLKNRAIHVLCGDGALSPLNALLQRQSAFATTSKPLNGEMDTSLDSPL
jgi:hypothetical protein